jgi:hypothetical protein
LAAQALGGNSGALVPAGARSTMIQQSYAIANAPSRTSFCSCREALNRQTKVMQEATCKLVTAYNLRPELQAIAGAYSKRSYKRRERERETEREVVTWNEMP